VPFSSCQEQRQLAGNLPGQRPTAGKHSDLSHCIVLCRKEGRLGIIRECATGHHPLVAATQQAQKNSTNVIATLTLTHARCRVPTEIMVMFSNSAVAIVTKIARF
jgi:hypothetical protein